MRGGGSEGPLFRRVGRLRLRTQIAIFTICLGGLVAGWHYWVIYSSLTAARTSLLGVETSLAGAGLDVDAADLREARTSVSDADENLSRARFHLKWDPFLLALRPAPILGDQVKAANDLLDMAEIVLEIGREGLIIGDRAVELRERPREGQPLTESVIDLLETSDPEFSKVERLTAQLLARRMALGDQALLPPLSSVRAALDEKLPEAADAIEEAQLVRQLLPGLTGFRGERQYLVLALNNGELLPGGGLVTAAAVVPVEDGVQGDMDFTDSTTWKASWEAKGGAFIEPPDPLGRYLLRGFTWNLLVSNWNPDFTVWAQQALEFYEMVHGPQDVDGVVAVDLEVLRRLLQVTGPKTIEVEGVGPVTFDSVNAVLEMERLTRQPFEPGGDRKSVIGDLANEVIADLLALPSDKWASAIKTIRALGDEKHFQVLMNDPQEQTLVRSLGWDGGIHHSPGSDYVHFNEASVNSTKLNLIIKPEGSLSVDIDKSGVARHNLVLKYHNSVNEWAKGKDRKLVEQLMLGGVYGGYLRLFVPGGTRDFLAKIDDSPAMLGEIEDEGGRVSYGLFVPVMPGASTDVTMSWVTALASDLPGTRSYSLVLEKQPGTDGVCLALAVSREGVAAGSLSVEGGRRDGQGRVCLTTDVTVTATFP